MARILLVEDDHDLAANIIDFLMMHQHLVTYAPNGALGLNYLIQETFDLALLDVRMPGLDGYSLCEKVRVDLKNDLPIIMITAADSIQDKIKGFRSGTDDYIVKPFSYDELLIRVDSILRRTRGRVIKNTVLRIGELKLDEDQWEVTREGVNLELSNMGFRILKILMRESPKIISRSELEEEIWGDDLPGSDALRSHIFALRNILDKPFDKPMLETLRGVGYRIKE